MLTCHRVAPGKDPEQAAETASFPGSRGVVVPVTEKVEVRRRLRPMR